MTSATLRLPAQVGHLTEAVAFVEQWVDHAELAADKKFCVTLAMEEAFINICHYAYPDQDGTVQLLCSLEKDFFIVELSDAGPPFDVLSIDSPDLEAGLMERKVGGLGIHFIRTLSDEVSYQRLAGHNILRMQFARSPGVASCNPNK